MGIWFWCWWGVRGLTPARVHDISQMTVRVCTRSSSSPTKLHLNPKFLVQINMSLPKSSSRKAEVSIQKAIQDVESGVEPSIRKASGVRALPHSTVAHRLAGRLPRHLAHKTLLYPYQEDQIVKWIHKCQSWGFAIKVNMLPIIANPFLAEGRVIGKH